MRDLRNGTTRQASLLPGDDRDVRGPVLNGDISDDGRKVVFGYNQDLWVRDMVAGETTSVPPRGRRRPLARTSLPAAPGGRRSRATAVSPRSPRARPTCPVRAATSSTSTASTCPPARSGACTSRATVTRSCPACRVAVATSPSGRRPPTWWPATTRAGPTRSSRTSARARSPGSPTRPAGRREQHERLHGRGHQCRRADGDLHVVRRQPGGGRQVRPRGGLRWRSASAG